MLNIHTTLRITLIIGSILFFVAIFILLKKKRLNVQYSILWLAAATVFLVFSIWPYLVAVLSTFFKIEMPVNLVFTILFCFVLLMLLSLSTIVTGFSARIKRLTQTQALLEERVRQLEAQLAESTAAAPANQPSPPTE